MKVNEIRKSYVDFFKQNEHYAHDSYPLVPINDPSLLLIGAGMAPLKNYFLGVETPPSKRMVTCQKCIRTGDIDNVGRTARHATFFEMLGNFSFGDYFKNRAIHLAWDYVTNVLKLDKDKLWVTVYEEDDEALELWAEQEGVPRERIVKLGKDDNFWEIGTGTGPCGPCSEIYLDRGPEFGCSDPNCKPGCDCDRFLEFWNLVFTQFDKDAEGNYNLLDNPNIDTGMGLERIACIMQNVDSIFDIDTMVAIRDKISALSSVAYNSNAKSDVSIRVIADHTRAVTFLLSDGVIPSNEGRGYVLRRLLRRAARHGKLLGIEGTFLNEVVDVVIREYQEAYPELLQKKDYIQKLVRIEESKFAETISQGLTILEQQIDRLEREGKDTLPGAEAFKLYDTFGFPLEITAEILSERGKKLDEAEFTRHMNEQRESARSARFQDEEEGWKKTQEALIPVGLKSEFLGYEVLEATTEVQFMLKEDQEVTSLLNGDHAAVVLKQTPFYPEGGGQIGDQGVLVGDGFEAVVRNTTKNGDGISVHHITVTSGILKQGVELHARVNQDRRKDTTKNHSATHLLHRALKRVLGEHVAQAGSHVDDKRLRFDFSHFEGINEEQLREVEQIVNAEIFNELPVSVQYLPIAEAKKMGAEAQFDEKYGDVVRVVRMGDFSLELCGGTHVSNTVQILGFKILSETSVASGIRRIEAITGRAVQNYLHEKELKISNITDILKSSSNSVEQRAEQVMLELRVAKKEIEKYKSMLASGKADTIVEDAVPVKGLKQIIKRMDNVSIDEMKELAQKIVDSHDDVVILLAGIFDEKVQYVSMSGTKAVVQKAHSGNIVKQVAQFAGGSGGGRPNFAQAGAKDASRLDASLEHAIEVIHAMIQ